jgi:hypothetical protein
VVLRKKIMAFKDIESELRSIDELFLPSTATPVTALHEDVSLVVAATSSDPDRLRKKLRILDASLSAVLAQVHDLMRN